MHWWTFGNRLVRCFNSFFDPDAPEQIVTLYSDAGCGEVAVKDSITYKDFVFPAGCTNTGSGTLRVGLTADCSPGWFTVPFALACPSCAVCCVPQLTCVFAASHLSVSIVVSCPCPPLLSPCCQLQAPNFTAFVSGAMFLAVLIARLNFFEIQATSQEDIVVIYRPN